MNERYYAGVQLEKDLELCKYIRELERHNDVLIIKTPERLVIHEMQYDRGCIGCRRSTGKKHTGYEFHYVSFLYKGSIFTVSPSPFYPFYDDNHPGSYNFVMYRRIRLNEYIQATYCIAYRGLLSIDSWLNKPSKTPDMCPVKEVTKQFIYCEINNSVVAAIESVLKTEGAFRENIIWKDAPILRPTETWNDEHKVIDVISSGVDTSGHRDSFSFDLVTHKICG